MEGLPGAEPRLSTDEFFDRMGSLRQQMKLTGEALEALLRRQEDLVQRFQREASSSAQPAAWEKLSGPQPEGFQALPGNGAKSLAGQTSVGPPVICVFCDAASQEQESGSQNETAEEEDTVGPLPTTGTNGHVKWEPRQSETYGYGQGNGHVYARGASMPELMLMDYWIGRKFAQLWNRCSQMKEPEQSGFLAWLMQSTRWELLSAAVIMSNSVWAISEVNRRLDDPHTVQDLSSPMSFVELAFLAFYSLEVCLKLSVHGRFFFVNKSRLSNVFDLTLTSVEILGWLFRFVREDDFYQFAFMRACRIVTRVLRVFRMVHVFSELRMILATLLASMVSVTWCGMVMIFGLVLFALMFTQLLPPYLAENGRFGEELEANFGSVGRAMLSLYMATTGGVDWYEYYDAFEDVGSGSASLFVAFTFLFNFGMFNLLTSMFIDRTIKACKPDMDALIIEQRAKEHTQTIALRKTLSDVGKDGNDVISLNEFMTLMRDQDVCMFLAAMGLEIIDAEVFFRMLMEITGGNELPIDDFVQGCMRMKGQARGIDLQALQFEVRLLRKNVKSIMTMQEDMMHGLLSTRAPSSRCSCCDRVSRL